MRVGGVEDRLHRVDRAGADVAEHHPERTDDHGQAHDITPTTARAFVWRAVIRRRLLLVEHGEPLQAAATVIGTDSAQYRCHGGITVANTARVLHSEILDVLCGRRSPDQPVQSEFK
ncbi:hypothetical protein GCM10010112_83230 [Actinoplanes lobatus]|uniref:Uncharacterized protein n=1 Tax=Actinoplanes lobatus TaxID=113568 RepID=A0ABQ4AY45_9ACTN|nr:hypothetical protein GCM10010112_83230 [Actinoplanes lobatus]GIE45735.1 hypothetical protein Alo02nite_86330 [Actinoplanes lobatus]